MIAPNEMTINNGNPNGRTRRASAQTTNAASATNNDRPRIRTGSSVSASGSNNNSDRLRTGSVGNSSARPNNNARLMSNARSNGVAIRINNARFRSASAGNSSVRTKIGATTFAAMKNGNDRLVTGNSRMIVGVPHSVTIATG